MSAGSRKKYSTFFGKNFNTSNPRQAVHFFLETAPA